MLNDVTIGSYNVFPAYLGSKYSVLVYSADWTVTNAGYSITYNGTSSQVFRVYFQFTDVTGNGNSIYVIVNGVVLFSGYCSNTANQGSCFTSQPMTLAPSSTVRIACSAGYQTLQNCQLDIFQVSGFLNQNTQYCNPGTIQTKFVQYLCNNTSLANSTVFAQSNRLDLSNLTFVQTNDRAAFTKNQYNVTINVAGSYRVMFSGMYLQPASSSNFYMSLNKNTSNSFAFLKLNFSSPQNGQPELLTFEGLAFCSVGDTIDVQCNSSSNQIFYTPQLYIQQVINDFQAANQMVGLLDFTPNSTNGNIVAYNSTTSKYVSSDPSTLNVVTKTGPTLITGQKTFSGTQTTCMINSTSPTIPFCAQNSLGTCSLQLSSNGQNSFISQVTDDFQITNSIDGIPFL